MEMINPIIHATTAREVDIYKVEPYVLAADVYAVSPHVGRGGWTWYTGSAGWMYRLIVESLLGLHLEANTLTVKPCIPAHWNSFKLTYRFRDTTYHISVMQISTAAGAAGMRVDGAEQADGVIRLCDDGETHVVEITMARAE
jgi:cellobiose phosphorylase